RWLNENKPEAVMLVGYHRLPLLGALLWCRLRGVPALLWGDSNVRGDRLKGLKRRVKQSVLPWVLRQYSACLACGSMGQQFFQRYGVKSDRLHLSPVEPDYDQIERLDSSWEEEATKRFGLDNGMRRIVISSRLVGIKRVDLSIRAFAAIAAERAGWEMVILGDGPERAALEALVPAGLKHRVRFMGFVGQQELVTSVYRRSEVLLHAASWEPWALVINEATAAGLAMVTTEAVGA
ncbi:MAG TPA: hypothetical protein DEB06_10340, partial [Phycisphaerales bacterium]|nr:hypothetical protein [Phycisphaerales bacterium]